MKTDKYPLQDKLEVFQENQGRTKTRKQNGEKSLSKWCVPSSSRGLTGEQGGGRRTHSLFLLQRGRWRLRLVSVE